MSSVELRNSERDGLEHRIRESRQVRVPLAELLGWWSAVAPRLIGDPTQAAGLHAALREFADSGLITLPAQSWDTSLTPPLPRFINIPTARRTARAKPWLPFPWRAELGWASSMATMTDTQFNQLVAINDWLARTATASSPTVPHRFRSAELFGDEKALDTLAKGSLFAPGRLSYQLLACTRYPSPLPAAVVGNGPDVLIVENADPYWVAVETLRAMPGHAVGAVVWGSGRVFPTQVASLGVDVAGRGPVTGIAWYWGDLDPAGVAIAADAAAAAAAMGVAEVRPPAALWSAFASCPVTAQGTQRWSTAGRSWLGEELWEQLKKPRDLQGRVAQEAVPVAAIERWAAG